MPATKTVEGSAQTTRSPAVWARGLEYAYASRPALQGVDLEVWPGEIFALLGPNGGGKSTLLGLLSTRLELQKGEACILGHDLRGPRSEVRRQLGVIFQRPALDPRLTVAENLRYHGRLYRMGGRALERRIRELLERFDLLDRAAERVERLSGGLARRVELAKGLLHRPRLLLMDEPSTGLDPAARRGFWRLLRELREGRKITVVISTHLAEEGEESDRVAIIDRGRVVCQGTPGELKGEIGSEVITVRTGNPNELARAIRERLGQPCEVVDGMVRMQRENGHEWLPRLVEAFPGQVEAVTVSRPTLEDVFFHRTGRLLERGLPDRGAGGDP